MGKWYEQGYQDAQDGLPFDPPYQPGNKHYVSYCDGYADGSSDHYCD